VASLNFPDPVSSPWTDPNGRIWTHDGDGWIYTKEAHTHLMADVTDAGDLAIVNMPPSDGKYYCFKDGVLVEADIGFPTLSEHGGAFTVSEADGFDHFYRQSGIGEVTIPDGLSVGFRFSMLLKDTSIINKNSWAVTLPTDKQLAPFGQNATIGVVVGTKLFIFGDLADA